MNIIWHAYWKIMKTDVWTGLDQNSPFVYVLIQTNVSREIAPT